jgi:vacuolar-type H+-ATPase subunit I/STV1
MKELLELESWANKVIANEAIQDRPLERSRDIQYQASRQYPDRSPEQALQLYVSKKLADSEKTDFEQNKLINAQKRQNDKLTRTLDELGNELRSHEVDAQKTDQEVERLKALSAKLKPQGEITQQAAKVSADELHKLEASLNLLKDKPGMDDKKFIMLKNKVEQMSQLKSVDGSDVKKLEAVLGGLANKQGISDELFNRTISQLEDTQEKLDAKEKRFGAYIEKKGKDIENLNKSYSGDLAHYANIINKYKDDITNFEKDMKGGRAEIKNEIDIVRTLRGDLQQEIDNVQTTSDDVTKILNYLNGLVATNPAVKAQQTVDKARQPQQQKRQDVNIDQYVSKDSVFEGKDITNEDIRVSRQWEDPEFTAWMTKNLPVLVNIFKRNFKLDLARKSPTYGDHQISYKIEEFAHWLDNDDPIITQEKMDTFMTAVKLSLFKDPVEPEQDDLFSESLDTTYERMLDTLIDSCFIKNTHKK